MSERKEQSAVTKNTPGRSSLLSVFVSFRFPQGTSSYSKLCVGGGWQSYELVEVLTVTILNHGRSYSPSQLTVSLTGPTSISK